MSKDLFVTKPYLPPLEEFVPYLEKIWESKWLTNNGPFHQQLESALCHYLGVEYISLFSNGTLALMTALQVLRLDGEVITTPFSFVATTHALHWNGLKPVFVDIDSATLNLCPKKIEAAITPRTTAILPVHVYGQPCAVEEMQKIADRYGLKVIYDAAHAFGVKLNNETILNYGDLSVLSFHSTKVFNTFEGGAIICKDAKMKEQIDYLKNFGFADETVVIGPGINGKMNEIQASFGILQLKYIEEAIGKRKNIDQRYREGLSNIQGIRLLEIPKAVKHNFSYFPILIEKSFPLSRDRLNSRLRDQKIFSRRYFYPLISEFSSYSGLPSAVQSNLPIAVKAANEILCLPIYPDLEWEDQNRIIKMIESLSHGNP